MFDFHFGSLPVETTLSPWGTPADATRSQYATPHDFGTAFQDVTNEKARETGDAAGHPVKPINTSIGDRAWMPTTLPTTNAANSAALWRDDEPSPAASPIFASRQTSDMMLVKGDFLSATRLLQLAQNSAADQTFSTTMTSTASTLDANGLDSRCSTPMDVANAVLFGTDEDTPPEKPTRSSLNTTHNTTNFSVREYSSFCVSAGASRDVTPVSPTQNGIASHFETFGTMFTTQTSSLLGSATGSLRGATNTTTSSLSQYAPAYQPQQQSSANHMNATPTDSCARRAVRSHHVPTVVPVQKPVIFELTGVQTCVLVLEFKMGRKLRCRCDLADMTAATSVGQYFVAVVDSSNLEDAGVCTAVVPMNERQTLHRTFGHNDQATILRAANVVDCGLINDELPDMEEAALLCCHDLIHFLHLPFVCIDAEYSFDKKGCKIFYSLAPQQCTSIVPNVSRLQRELGCKLKCKIILEQVRHPQQQPSSTS